MNKILKETRSESYIQRPCKRKNAILSVLNGKERTARQIAYELGYADLNAVKPRLTELMREGKVEVVGKAIDMLTGRNVAIYRNVIDEVGEKDNEQI